MDPIDLKHSKTMNEVADSLRHIFGGYGFCLLVFDFGESGRMNYISNAERESMIEAMQEFIDKHKEQTEG